ncbi:hypothetical protein BDQ17DRAFT_1372074 [Cyathus striatus]|nr:hypothetical protein BDQ17DRAFT_1372074 [Cyathus striatus]
MFQFLPNRQHETTHQCTNLQSQTSAPTRSRVVPATPNPPLPLRSKTAITSPTPRSRSPISQPTPYRAESATPNTHSNYSYTPMAYHTEHADTNGSISLKLELPPFPHRHTHSPVNTAASKPQKTTTPLHRAIIKHRTNTTSNARVRQFRREAVETTRKPAYRANMKYSGRGEGSSRGTVVNIAGCDLAAFTKMGVGVDTFLGVHGEYGKDYEANIDGEGPGAFYNVAGVGYNPNFGHSS